MGHTVKLSLTRKEVELFEKYVAQAKAETRGLVTKNRILRELAGFDEPVFLTQFEIATFRLIARRSKDDGEPNRKSDHAGTH